MNPGVTAMIVASVVYGVLTILLFARMKWWTMDRGYLQSRPWGTLAWCALLPLGTMAPLGVGQELLLPNLKDVNAATFSALLSEPFGYLTIGIFAPLVEEVVFRGAILRTLLGKMGNRWLAIVISAVLFAAVHANPAQMPAALVMGILIGWVYSHTGSIVPGVAIHWVNNTVAFIVCALVPQSVTMDMVTFFGGESRALMAVGFSILILLPALYQLNVRFRR